MTIVFGWGIAFAVGSMILNGSYSSMSKLRKVRKCKIDAQIFNIYFAAGNIVLSVIVFISLLLLNEIVEFTYLGVLSGLSVGFSSFLVFATIEKIGLSIGIAIWSGVSIIVAFIEGVLFNKTPNHWEYSILGIIVLVIGIVGVALAKDILNYFDNTRICNKKTDGKITINSNSNTGMKKALLTETDAVVNCNDAGIDNESENINVIESETGDSNTGNDNDDEFNKGNDTESEKNKVDQFLGISYALLCGLFGGSSGFPETYTNKEDRDAKYLISYAAGMGIIITVTLLLKCIKKEKIEWHFNICFVPGIVSGIIYNFGNLCSYYAIASLSYDIAYPILRTSLLVGIIYGIFLWKEITDRKIIVLTFVFSLIIIGGCVLATYGVDG